MAKAAFKFTARNLPGLIARHRPSGDVKQVDIWDAAVDGLGVRVGAKSATWFVRYRKGGLRRRLSLNACVTSDAERTLKDAREAAKDALRAAEKGQDPAAVIQAQRAAETFAEMADDYLELYAKPNKKSWKRDEQIIERDLKPAFRGVKANEVRRKDVVAVLDRIAKRGPTQANRTFEVLRKMYRWAVGRDIVEVSPCYGVSKPAKEKRRERVLSNDEIERIWDRLPLAGDLEKGNIKPREDGRPVANMHPMTAYSLKLTLATAQRPGDVAGMRVEDIDREAKAWTIPGEFYKSGRAHVVPLSGFAIELLDEIAALKASMDQADKRKRETPYSDSPYVFPSPRGDGHIAEAAMAHAVNANRDTFETPARWTPHDLRRTAATSITGEEIGTSRFVLARILGHADREVTGTYDRYAYLREKRAALDAWGELLREVATGEARASNVVKLGAV